MSVLMLDIEGGHGGSSRSLRTLTQALARDRIRPIIWHRKNRDYGARLDALGIEHRYQPHMLNILPRPRKNWKLWLVNLPSLVRLRAVAGALRDASFDILHLNYEGLVPLHMAARAAGDRRPTVLHMRTMAPANWIYRIYARHINRHVAHIIFITENERARAVEAGIDLDRVASTVLYNPVDPEALACPPAIPNNDILQIAFVGMLDVDRAPDRLVDVAAALKARGVTAHFHVYGGAPSYRKWLFFRRRNLERLQSQVRRLGLSHLVTFHGHVREPSVHLRQADLMIRTSRNDDPWSRDVIEALAAGVPVLTHGTYDRFVRTGQSGILLPRWDADAYAETIAKLDRERDAIGVMARGAQDLAKHLFDPARYAERVTAIYEAVAGRDPAFVGAS